MKKDPVAVLEIGTSRTVVCVGEPDENGKIRLIGSGSCPSTGVRKGQIIDFKQVAGGVQAARAQAEDEAEVNIWQVMVAATGSHIKAGPHREMLPIESADKVVVQEDMTLLDEMLSEPPLDADRVVLHTLYQSFSVDDQQGIANPEGMRCNMLSRNALVVSALQNRVDNLKRVVGDDKLDVMDVVFDGVASSLSVLNTAQKRNGVVLIDLGAGTTSVMTFTGQVIADVFCLGVGGDHVTHDIACGFNIPVNRAEELKCERGSALLDAGQAYERIKLSDSEQFGPKSLSEKSLQVIINARMDELFKIIRDRLDERDLLYNLGSGVVLTGGGAYLKDVEKLAGRIFTLPCVKGQINNLEGFSGMKNEASYATAAGLLKYAFDSSNLRGAKPGFGTFISKIFRR